MRRFALLSALSLMGCGYPSFGFGFDVDASADADLADGENDSFAFDGNLPEGSPVDANIADSAVAEGAVADSAKSDSAKSDSTDSDSSTDTAPTTYCGSTSHAFCVDFDTSTDPLYGFSSTYITGGGDVALNAPAYSAPRSFLSQVPAGTAGAAATLVRALDAPASNTLTRVDARVRLGTTSMTPFLLMKLQRNIYGASVWMSVSGPYAEAFGAAYKSYPLAKSLAVDTWYHVRIEATLAISGARFRVFIDDMSTPLLDVADTSTAMTEGTAREAGFGLYTGPSTYPAFSARYDDVSVDWL